MPQSAKKHSARKSGARKHRRSRLYDKRVWRRISRIIRDRDVLCRKCRKRLSTQTDHIKPHKGNIDLFLSESNLQGLCEVCHGEKSAGE